MHKTALLTIGVALLCAAAVSSLAETNAADPPVVPYETLKANPQQYEGQTIILEKIRLFGGIVQRGERRFFQISSAMGRDSQMIWFPASPEPLKKITDMKLKDEYYSVRATCRVQKGQGAIWEALVLDIDVLGAPAAKAPAAKRPEVKFLGKLELNAAIARLILSPDGKYLYVLNRTDHKIQRVNLAKRELDGEVAIAAGEEYMCLSPDGKTLYASASPDRPARESLEKPATQESSKIQVIDAAAMKITKSFTIRFDPFEMEATNSGLLYMSPNSWTANVGAVSVLDTKGAAVARKFHDHVENRTQLQMSADRTRMFLSKGSEVEILLMPRKQEPPVELEVDKALFAHLNERAEYSPDGRFYVLLRNAQVCVAPIEPSRGGKHVDLLTLREGNDELEAATFVPERRLFLAAKSTGVLAYTYTELEAEAQKRDRDARVGGFEGGYTTQLVCEPKRMLICTADSPTYPQRREDRFLSVPKGDLSFFDGSSLIAAPTKK